jgi:hypothetical protein
VICCEVNGTDHGPWVPSDPGPDDVSDEPPFGSLQFTALEVLKGLKGQLADCQHGTRILFFCFEVH